MIVDKMDYFIGAIKLIFYYFKIPSALIYSDFSTQKAFSHPSFLEDPPYWFPE